MAYVCLYEYPTHFSNHFIYILKLVSMSPGQVLHIGLKCKGTDARGTPQSVSVGLPSQVAPSKKPLSLGLPFHKSGEKQILWLVRSHKGRQSLGPSSVIYLLELRTEWESAVMPDVPLVLSRQAEIFFNLFTSKISFPGSAQFKGQYGSLVH